MVRECRLPTARTIPQPIRVYRYQPDPSGKLSIIVTGILQRNDVPRRLKPCQTIFFTLRRIFFLTENVLGSRVEGCPCIPWPHLTDRKAIGIDISLSIHRDPPLLLLLLLHHTIKSHIIKAFTSILTLKYNKKPQSQAPPFPPYPD